MSHTITATVEEVETLIAAFNDKSPSEEVSCDGCPGLCCRCFPLVSRYDNTLISPEVLLSHIKNQGKHPAPDWLFALKNFIYLGDFHKNPIVASVHDDAMTLHKRSYYTCRQLGLDGKCMDYDNRPSLCRDYGVTNGPDAVDCKLHKKTKFEIAETPEISKKERS